MQTSKSNQVPEGWGRGLEVRKATVTFKLCSPHPWLVQSSILRRRHRAPSILIPRRRNLRYVRQTGHDPRALRCDRLVRGVATSSHESTLNAVVKVDLMRVTACHLLDPLFTEQQNGSAHKKIGEWNANTRSVNRLMALGYRTSNLPPIEHTPRVKLTERGVPKATYCISGSLHQHQIYYGSFGFS